MKLYTLYFGRSKKRMKPIMTDDLKKCENYKKSREKNVVGWHDIRPAESGTKIWKQKTATIGKDKGNRNPPIVGKGPSGYISKNGFNPHT